MKLNVKITNNTLSFLAGNEYGQRIFKDTTENFVLDLDNEKVIFEFSDNINNVAISFVEGFMMDLKNKYTKNQIVNNVTIEGKENIIKKFKEVI